MRIEIASLFGILSFATVVVGQTKEPPVYTGGVEYRSTLDTAGKPIKQEFYISMPGKKPLLIEHGLDLPEFRNAAEYNSDVERYRRDAHALKMLDLGVRAKVIRSIPTNLKGEKFREWINAQAVVVENSACTNKLVRDEFLSRVRSSDQSPPPPIVSPPDSLSLPKGSKTAK